MALESLGEQLRQLPEVDVPETLAAKLLAAIPTERANAVVEYRAEHHPGRWDFWATAVAAILILALMLSVNYGLSTPSQTLPTKLKDISLCHAGWDLHPFLGDQNTFAEDTNYANWKW